MRQNLIRSCGSLVAIAFACQSALADDRKSVGRFQESKEQTFVTQKGHQTSFRYELTRPLLLTTSKPENSVLTDRRLGYVIEESNPNARAHEHKSLTLFRVNSKVGQITVQPVIGHVTGAQCSIGF
jgi:hypothetical protein